MGLVQRSFFLNFVFSMVITCVSSLSVIQGLLLLVLFLADSLFYSLSFCTSLIYFGCSVGNLLLSLPLSALS